MKGVLGLGLGLGSGLGLEYLWSTAVAVAESLSRPRLVSSSCSSRTSILPERLVSKRSNSFLIVASLQRSRSGDFPLDRGEEEPSLPFPSFPLPLPFGRGDPDLDVSLKALGSLALEFQSARGELERPSLAPLRSPPG